MKSILCAGCVTTDVIVSPVDALPEPGQLAAVRSTQVHVGGCAANAAIDLAKLGLPATLCAVVGDDSFGRFVEDTARAAGVDVSGLVMKKGVETTSSVVCVDSQGERRFLYNPGSIFRCPCRCSSDCGGYSVSLFSIINPPNLFFHSIPHLVFLLSKENALCIKIALRK